MIENGQIYKITNLINGKGYVGLTGQELGKTFEDRFKEHISNVERGEEFIICRAIRKYGKENFRIELLEEGITNKTELGEREKYYIKIHNTYAYSKDGFGYNQTIGGEGVVGYIHTKESRKKRGEFIKNLWLEPEFREKMEGRNSKDIVIFKNGEYLNTFSSITNAAKNLKQVIGGSEGGLRNRISFIANNGLIPSRGLLKGYSVMFKEDYEKLQEDQLQIS